MTLDTGFLGAGLAKLAKHYGPMRSPEMELPMRLRVIMKPQSIPYRVWPDCAHWPPLPDYRR